MMNRLDGAAPCNAHDLRRHVYQGLPAALAKVFQTVRHVGGGKVVKENDCIIFSVLGAHGSVEDRVGGFVIAVDKEEGPFPVVFPA